MTLLPSVFEILERQNKASATNVPMILCELESSIGSTGRLARYGFVQLQALSVLILSKRKNDCKHKFASYQLQNKIPNRCIDIRSEKTLIEFLCNLEKASQRARERGRRSMAKSI